MAVIYLRTAAMFLFLIIAVRLMGKRQVGELEISELVITFLLSEMAVIPIADRNAPIIYSVVPILALLSFEIILSFIISRSSGFKKLLLGRPYVVIRRGVIDQDGLSKLRMNPSELMSELRLKGIASLDEVEYAMIEDNGQLSVFKKAGASPVTAEVLEIETAEKGIALCIIVDGKLYPDNLAELGHDASWVESQLTARGIRAGDVYLMTADDSGDVIIVTKDGR